MSLEQAYNSVPNTPITNLSCGGRIPIIQRDVNIMRFENDVFQQIINALPPPAPTEQNNDVKTPIVHNVSVEDAIRELIEMEKAGKLDC